MKKFLTIFLAFIIALILNELFVRYIINYPAYGVKKKMFGIRADGNSQNIFNPYSKYWNVEGGNRVFRRNNLGFPGTNVNVSDSAKYIFVLGSSYVEAYQIEPDKIATSLFAEKIKTIDPKFEVLNLGCSGHDAMDSYFRTKYFMRKFKPSYIVLVIDDLHENWMNANIYRHNTTLTMVEKSDKFTILQTQLRNLSNTLNLAANAFVGQEHETETIKNTNPVNKNQDCDTIDMYNALKAFVETFKSKFVVVSAAGNETLNNYLLLLSQKLSFTFLYNSEITKPANKIKGAGHLNEKGNLKLSNLIYEAFTKENLE